MNVRDRKLLIMRGKWRIKKRKKMVKKMWICNLVFILLCVKYYVKFWLCDDWIISVIFFYWLSLGYRLFNVCFIVGVLSLGVVIKIIMILSNGVKIIDCMEM